MGRRLTTLIVAAHPDDEVVAAGIWIHRHRGKSVHILHITDGSPRDMENARAQGFRSRKAYARSRRRELAEALSLVAVPPGNCAQFSFADKDAYLHLPALIGEMEALIAEIKPDRVFSPAYEGGHPDHDAAAFAVAMARRHLRSFTHWEYPLYHSSPRGRMIAGRFIARDNASSESVIRLSREERFLKARMFACFPTQKEILSCFKLNCERFRRARAYDFSLPPHRGPLLYERWGWKITGADWRRRASESFNRVPAAVSGALRLEIADPVPSPQTGNLAT